MYFLEWCMTRIIIRLLVPATHLIEYTTCALALTQTSTKTNASLAHLASLAKKYSIFNVDSGRISVVLVVRSKREDAIVSGAGDNSDTSVSSITVEW
jgi:hypothetical protein